MRKADELLDPNSCLNKAGDDEPLFVLKGSDPTAAQTVRLWASMNARLQPEEKIKEALALAEDMDHCNKPKAGTVTEVP